MESEKSAATPATVIRVLESGRSTKPSAASVARPGGEPVPPLPGRGGVEHHVGRLEPRLLHQDGAAALRPRAAQHEAERRERHPGDPHRGQAERAGQLRQRLVSGGVGALAGGVGGDQRDAGRDPVAPQLPRHESPPEEEPEPVHPRHPAAVRPPVEQRQRLGSTPVPGGVGDYNRRVEGERAVEGEEGHVAHGAAGRRRRSDGPLRPRPSGPAGPRRPGPRPGTRRRPPPEPPAHRRRARSSD